MTESVASQTFTPKTLSCGTDNCAADLSDVVEKSEEILKPIICSRCKQAVSLSTTDKIIEEKSLQDLFKVCIYLYM